MVGEISCSVPGYGVGETDRTNLRIHFLHCHVRDALVILEEGNHPHPWFPERENFVPWAALNRRHPTTELCTQGGGSEIQDTWGGGGKGGGSTGLHRIWTARVDGVLLTLPGEDDDGNGQRLAGGSWEPYKFPPKMGDTGKDPWAVRGGCMNLRAILRGGCAGDPILWVGYVGDDLPHCANLGGVPPSRGPERQWEAPMTPHGRGLLYPTL